MLIRAGYFFACYTGITENSPLKKGGALKAPAGGVLRPRKRKGEEVGHRTTQNGLEPLASDWFCRLFVRPDYEQSLFNLIESIESHV